VVESIEHLGAELNFHSLVDRKRLDKTKIDVPVTRAELLVRPQMTRIDLCHPCHLWIVFPCKQT
jgi:hypothetical protein